ncbi:MAG TPA: DsbA family protein [Nitrososphaeraceae archaeon]|nr:DsbA family protein [Nitrososphaeraceae archaeon]
MNNKRKAAENIKLTLPVSESRDHIQGPVNAPITLVEYGDYECPYCGRAYMIIKEIQERLGSKLCFVFRNFPLTKVRPHAYKAAIAAETAAAQGKFWDMYDYLFKHGQVVTDENLRQSAAKLGLNVARFDREFLDRTYSSHVDEDIQSGKSSGVKSTPTFFINGDRYNSAWDMDTLLSALDEESVFSWRQTNSSI